jgi:hypothetical protein
VRRVKDEPSAVARANWLAELAQALADAQALLWCLGTAGVSAEGMALYGQIEAALNEVRVLQVQGNRRANQLPWHEVAGSWPARHP